MEILTTPCPVFDFTCPYYSNDDGICTLENAIDECDAFACFYAEDDE